MNKESILILSLGLSACSNSAVYENMRIYQRKECLKEPPSRYEECIKQVEKPYAEYQRERDEALE